MAEGACRHWIETRPARHRARVARDGREGRDDEHASDEAQLLARRLADLAWAGLRAVHAD